MVRITTQVLIGLMLLFGTVTLTPRLLYHMRERNFVKALYFMLLWIVSLAFSIAAFYYAFLGITELT